MHGTVQDPPLLGVQVLINCIILQLNGSTRRLPCCGLCVVINEECFSSEWILPALPTLREASPKSALWGQRRLGCHVKTQSSTLFQKHRYYAKESGHICSIKRISTVVSQNTTLLL